MSEEGTPTNEQWKEFLTRVSENYDADDRERQLQDRAWEISSQELHELHEQLAASSATKLALERDRLTSVVQTTQIGLCLIDANHTIVEINNSGAAFLRTERESALGSNVFNRLWPDDRRGIDVPPAELRVAISQRRKWSSDSVQLQLEEDRTTTCTIVYTPLKPDGNNGGLIAFHDQTSQEQAVEDVAWRKSHDSLTGLFNRSAITAYMDTALREASGTPLRRAVLFIDLDRFKTINDTSGHDVGDAVLVQAASRIRNAVRNEDVVARLGDDEFIVFLENIPGNENVLTVADRILNSIRLPFRSIGHSIHLSASIGYTVTASPEDKASDLLRDADIALYRAKVTGRDKAVAFNQDLRESVEYHVALDQKLRLAVEENALTVAFQPLVDMRTREVIAFETLARWSTPEGPIGPDVFIPMAEENGLISAIGKMALTEALSFAAQIRANEQQLPSDSGLLAVNVSGVQLSRGGFAALVGRCLESAQVPASALMLELTESTLLTHGDKALTELKTLHDMGVRIAIDDFGTGWSSLSILRQFPIDCIKIDRSFVASMATNREDAVIVRAVVELGRTLGHTVVAEGVETQEQAEALLTMGCTFAQGYLYGRPAARDVALAGAELAFK